MMMMMMIVDLYIAERHYCALMPCKLSLFVVRCRLHNEWISLTDDKFLLDHYYTRVLPGTSTVGQFHVT